MNFEVKPSREYDSISNNQPKKTDMYLTRTPKLDGQVKNIEKGYHKYALKNGTVLSPIDIMSRV